LVPFTLTSSIEDIDEVAKRIEAELPGNAIISLKGDLASGKTTLVKAIVENRGYDTIATSPTFSLQHRYGDDIFHYDLYRKSFDDIASLGLLEEFEAKGWHLVEWMDEKLEKVLSAAGFDIYEISISGSGKERRYRVEVKNA